MPAPVPDCSKEIASCRRSRSLISDLRQQPCRSISALADRSKNQTLSDLLDSYCSKAARNLRWPDRRKRTWPQDRDNDACRQTNAIRRSLREASTRAGLALGSLLAGAGFDSSKSL